MFDIRIVLQKHDRKENGMETVKVSPKYQIVIPKRVRNNLKLSPGQKVQIFQYNNRIELVPERDISTLRGFLRGINSEFEREEDRL